MADVGYIAIVVAGFGAYWWRHIRPVRQRVAIDHVFTPDAEVALHVATHEATARGQEMSSLHVLYGLVQDEAVIGAIATAGGDPDALEDRILAALAAAMPGPIDDAREDTRWVVGHAATIAQRSGRRASCTDLWAFLGDSRAARLVNESQLNRRAILFALYHGGRDPELPPGDERDVFVVLRNDDYTTQQFVCTVLRDVFGIAEPQASAIMLATHTAGRAVIGRFSAATARSKIGEVRALAVPHGFPLWIGVEPA